MKIGIFGGSFNPIHTGHAILVNYLACNTDLDTVWLMVAPQNPLKSDYDHSYDLHRIRMTDMVARRFDNVITSGFEFSLPHPSYTVDTLDALSSKFPEDKFVLIIGADNWASFERWKNPEKIISNYEIYIYPRKGFEIFIPENLKSTVKALNSPIIEISSSIIRNKLQNGENASFYLPDDVYDYILKHNLYIPNYGR